MVVSFIYSVSLVYGLKIPHLEINYRTINRMGKRKASKTARKKQAKAASRSKNAKSKTTAFGVSVVKGSKGRGRQDFGNSVSVTSGKSHSQTPLVQTTTKSASSSSSTGFGRQKFAPSSHEIIQRQSSNDEQRNFDRELASLQERVDVKGQKRCNTRRKRNTKQQREQGQGSTSNALFGNLADSSIKMGPATVGEMVDDAADKVAAGMSDIGRQASSPMNSAPSVPPNTPSVPRARFELTGSQSAPHEQQQQSTNNNLLQVLAAKKKAEWAAQKYMIQPETNGQGHQDSSMGDNRFAFLDNGDSDDDDDNGWGANGDAAVGINLQPPAFQFAPASFAATTTTSTTGSAHGNPSAAVDDDDPDL